MGRSQGTGRSQRVDTGAEEVVLLDEAGRPIGTADKAAVHSTVTPLHLAFSVHVFDGAGRILVTRRSLDKLTWPGVWTNSFCGHPGPGESMEDAVHRRADRELGLTVQQLVPVAPGFRYRATDVSGVVEHEVCPVYTAIAASELHPAPDEVMDWRWVDPGEVVSAVSLAPWAFSPWLVLQLPLLYPAPAQGRAQAEVQAGVQAPAQAE